MTIQDIAEPRNQCNVGNTRKLTGLQTEEQMKPKFKKKSKHITYTCIVECARTRVWVGWGVMRCLEKKFSLLLSISTCICRYIRS